MPNLNTILKISIISFFLNSCCYGDKEEKIILEPSFNSTLESIPHKANSSITFISSVDTIIGKISNFESRIAFPDDKGICKKKYFSIEGVSLSFNPSSIGHLSITTFSDKKGLFFNNHHKMLETPVYNININGTSYDSLYVEKKSSGTIEEIYYHPKDGIISMKLINGRIYYR